ncbi:transposase [Bradyrhizobium sp. 187]|uniref:transposase n=1 Tax=Bradyrhizobium sp. 187 TaxID=2782655 RepID=UPI001FFF43D4|nr:transposase [Bradyrhizobium sp. 187]UPJ76889.1 transposase [Bradyrhizobium sp. 187]
MTQVLVPTLRLGVMVVMESLAAHKLAEVGIAVEAAGAKLLYPPPYSPDLNPIELAFKLKVAPAILTPDQSSLWTTLSPSAWPPSPPKNL